MKNPQKYSVGIGGSNHDFASCIINENGKIFAIEDERINRLRYSLFVSNPCELSFRYLLDWIGILPQEIDHVVGNDYLLEPYSKTSNGNSNNARIKKEKFPPIIYLNHHKTHAYSTFFTSPFDEAAILIADGTGSRIESNLKVPVRETMTFSVGYHNTIKRIGLIKGESIGFGYSPEYPPLFQNSLGHLYRAVTQVIGFGWMNAGKTMGLAPYGDDRYVEEIMQYIRLLPDGQFQINMGTKDGLLTKLIQLREEGSNKFDFFEVDSALAFGVQEALETIIFHSLDYLWEQTKTPNLCLAGGIALNSLLNGKIPKRTKFKNIHIVFSPGDGGTAIGAAIWDYLQKYNTCDSLIRFESSPFLGRSYSGEDIKTSLINFKLNYSSPSNIFNEAAQLIANGKTLGWFQDGAEFGPRALGHRSILGDPRNPKMVDHINKNIKGREWFRPIAPAVIEPAAATYFEVECHSPYMQFVWPVREQYQPLLPAITHIDGGSRVQCVTKKGNESLYALLEEFGRITGFPILINTSFNILGDPIVETPQHAIESFLKSSLDALVLGEYLIKK